MPRTLAVCYYPEKWPQTLWPEDARRMVEAGIGRVRIGEFAWARLEPEPEHLVFDWLDRAIAVLADAGLEIVLSTPTAAPPIWMLDRHPDMLALDETGRPRGFGSRRHYCFSHLGYRAEAVRMARLLGERYGMHPGVVAWQIDNEYGCHQTAMSYSAAAREGFRHWLAERYGDIRQLNEVWGNVFWSMEYRRFNEIDLPNGAVTEANPAHWLAFRHYTSDQVVAFNRAQAEVLRPLCPGRTLIHNYMGLETGFDHFTVGVDLDAASWDAYPLGMLEDRVPADTTHRHRYRRQGDPDFQAFHHDLYRAVGRGRWWVMELQPGPVNWAPYNPAPLPGMTRLWALEAFAHGAETVCWFRWRQAPFGQEQMHAGLLRPDDRPAPGLAEVRLTADDLKVLARMAPDLATVRGDVALLVDYPSLWAWEIQPQGAGFNGFTLLFEAYRALRRRSLSIDIVPTASDSLAGYRCVLALGLYTWTDAARRLLGTTDGPVLLGLRTGSKTPDFAIPSRLPPDCPDWLDIAVAFVESLRPDGGPALAGGGRIERWIETIEAGPQVETLLQTTEGAPVLLRQDRFHYLAGWPDATGFDGVLNQVIPPQPGDLPPLPTDIRTRRLGPLHVVLNYGPESVALTPWLGPRDWIIGSQILPPAGVGVFLTRRASRTGRNPSVPATSTHAGPRQTL